ncbi:MAG: hypothetical protein NUW01_02770 [Gemmatimonadaceae bacterium]|nr:hypothetical protein [Gemmatimonadaceae bacterium]
MVAPKLIAIDRLRVPNDETILPRLREDGYLVSEYVAAMQVYDGWGEFPPIVTDQDLLILDGVTRILAGQRAKITKVPVIIEKCETAGERLLVAARGNASNGKRWDHQAMTRMTILAERFGVDVGDLAIALHVPVSRIERVPISTITRNGISEKVYTKRAVRPQLRGKELTEAQVGLMRQITTPNPANRILKDLLRLAELDALPALDEGSHRDLLRVRMVLDEWEARDAHLLEQEEAVA